MLLSIYMKVITTNSNSSLSDIFKDTQTQPLHVPPIISLSIWLQQTQAGWEQMHGEEMFNKVSLNSGIRPNNDIFQLI